MSLQLRTLLPPGLIQGQMLPLDAPEVEVSGSLWGGRALNYVSAVNTISVLYRLSRESRFVPYSPTMHWYSHTKLTAVTPLQLSQSAVCKSLLLPPRWKSFQVPFHQPPVLLAFQRPKPTSSRWTRWPKPGAPEIWFWAGLELNTGCLEHGHLLIHESDQHSAT